MYRKKIVDIFKSLPELSSREFMPVIIRDGQPVKDERYRINHGDGRVMLNGTHMKSDSRVLKQVDWELTYTAIKDKLPALAKGYKRVASMRSEAASKHPLKALFDEWKANTNFSDHSSIAVAK